MTRPIVRNVEADYMQVAQADRTYLYMNFARSYKSHLLTSARASTGNILDTTGKVNAVPYGFARVTDLGLLIEETSTNVATINIASWTTLASTITANSVLAPNDRIEATLLTDDLTTAFHGVNTANYSGDVSAAITTSIFAKMGTARYLQISMVGSGTNSQHYVNFDLLNGIIGTTGTNATGTITLYGNGWCRCSMTFTPIATSTTLNFRVGMVSANNSVKLATFVGTGLNTVYLWGPQIETKDYMTSYIGAVATRAIDNYTVTGLTRPTAFTLFAEVLLDRDTGKKQTLFSFDDGTNNNSLYAERTAAGSVSIIWREGAVNIWTSTFAAKTGARYIRIAVAYSAGEWRVFCDSEAETQSDTIAATLTTLHLGSAGNNTSMLDGLLTRLIIYNVALTNLEMSQLTSLVDISLHSASLIQEGGDFLQLEDASYILLE